MLTRETTHFEEIVETCHAVTEGEVGAVLRVINRRAEQKIQNYKIDGGKS